MIKLHHLEYSRSTRIIWLLEELGLEYDMQRYRRNEEFRAPPELRRVHPLGKAPTVEIDGQTMAESGAVIEYIIEQHGNGKLAPAPGKHNRPAYLEWLHFAEGSLALPVILNLIAARFGGAGPLEPMLKDSASKLLDHVEKALEDRDWLVGNGLTGADINVWYAIEMANGAKLIAERPSLQKYLERVHSRPAFERAIEKGGEVVPPFTQDH